MKNNKKYCILGGILCLAAVIFTAIALTHPELAFPWPNWVSYAIYALYLIFTVLVFCMPKFKNPSLAACGILAMQLAALALVFIYFGTRNTPHENDFYLFSALFLAFFPNLLNLILQKRKGKSK